MQVVCVRSKKARVTNGCISQINVKVILNLVDPALVQQCHLFIWSEITLSLITKTNPFAYVIKIYGLCITKHV